MVYFIQAGTRGPIKIGHTRRGVWRRLEQLQIGQFQRLSLIGIAEGNGKREHEIHKACADLHIRAEWFSDAPKLRQFIEGPPPAKPSLPPVDRSRWHGKGIKYRKMSEAA